MSDRPESREGETFADYARRVYAFNDARTDRANAAFDEQFRKSLREPEPAWRQVISSEDDGDVRYLEGFVSPLECAELFGAILVSTQWRDDSYTLYGRTVAVPRRQQWFADDPSLTYTYSRLTLTPQPWTKVLERLRRDVEAATGERFNAALVNLYVDGSHCVGWHADDETGVGSTIASVSLGSTIASVSLGAARNFALRKTKQPRVKRKLALADGSLLVMAGETQQHWQHSLPRRLHCTEPRINVTFRQMEGPTT